MSLYNYLKDVVSDTAISNLAVLTNEKAESLRDGMNLAIGSFLISVQKFTEEKSGLELLNILSAGGHSGEILNNFDNFTASTEKTSLLETIGNNITRHFVGDSVNDIAAEIGEQTGLSKKTAFTLLSFSAPLTLGVLGKTVKDSKLSDDDVVDLLKKEVSELKTVLVPTMGEVLGIKGNSKSSVLKENKIEWIHILPWVFLTILGLGVYFFAQRNKEEPQQAILIPEQEAVFEENIPQKDSVKVNLNPETNPVKELPVETKTEPIQKEQEPIQKEQVRNEAPKELSTSKIKEVDTKKVNNTPKGLKVMSNKAFKEGSAEVIQKSDLDNILNELASESDKSITLTPLSGAGRLGEDRVYALRDWLFENGVPIDRINISKPKTGFNSAGFGFVIN